MEGLASIDDSIAAKGEKIYDEKLASILEPDQIGQFLAIDVASENYAVGDTMLDALHGLRAIRPDAFAYFMRIGYTTAAAIGASLQLRKPKGAA